MNEKKQIMLFKISHAMHGLLTSRNIVSSFFKTGVHHQKQGFQKNFSQCKHYTAAIKSSIRGLQRIRNPLNKQLRETTLPQPHFQTKEKNLKENTTNHSKNIKTGPCQRTSKGINEHKFWWKNGKS